MTCEFCGGAFPLALSHSLLPPKWHYRIAGHLPSRQVQALLPALASSSVVDQFRHVEEPPLAHVLGLQVKFEDRAVEVDVAIYVPDRDWLAVVGEVKGANRIDAKDVANLEYVAARLAAKDVRCLSMFATMKDRFGRDEFALLRKRVERSRLVTTTAGSLLPDMPLVLTGLDLSHSPDSEAHPWRWDSKSHSGLQGTAITSCERNLGLVDYSIRGDRISCEWTDAPT